MTITWRCPNCKANGEFNSNGVTDYSSVKARALDQHRAHRLAIEAECSHKQLSINTHRDARNYRKFNIARRGKNAKNTTGDSSERARDIANKYAERAWRITSDGELTAITWWLNYRDSLLAFTGKPAKQLRRDIRLKRQNHRAKRIMSYQENLRYRTRALISADRFAREILIEEDDHILASQAWNASIVLWFEIFEPLAELQRRPCERRNNDEQL